MLDRLSSAMQAPWRRAIPSAATSQVLAGLPYDGKKIIKVALPRTVVSGSSGRSGVRGCVTRAKQFARKEYPRGGRRHVVLKRGLDPSANRRVETASRAPRKRPASRP